MNAAPVFDFGFGGGVDPLTAKFALLFGGAFLFAVVGLWRNAAERRRLYQERFDRERERVVSEPTGSGRHDENGTR